MQRLRPDYSHGEHVLLISVPPYLVAVAACWVLLKWLGTEYQQEVLALIVLLPV